MTSESHTQTRFVELVFPENTNHYRTLFAGNGLSMMAKSAFIAATRYARQRFVLAKSEQVNFKAPAREGEMIELIAEIAETGENSVIVSGELWAEELLTGERRLCITASFTLKPVDEAGKPVPLKTPT